MRCTLPVDKTHLMDRINPRDESHLERCDAPSWPTANSTFFLCHASRDKPVVCEFSKVAACYKITGYLHTYPIIFSLLVWAWQVAWASRGLDLEVLWLASPWPVTHLVVLRG